MLHGALAKSGFVLSLPLKKGSDILGAAVHLGLDLMAGEALANLLEVELILVECILLQSVNIDFAERHGYFLL
jgi:hypothetical protein